MKKQYKEIFWDFNGTLLNDFEAAHNICDSQLRARNYNGITRDAYRANFRMPVRSFYTDIGVDFDVHSYEELATEFHHEYLRVCSSCPLHSRATELIEWLANRGVTHSIVSALPQQILEDILHHKNVYTAFRRIVGADNNSGSGKVEKARGLFIEGGFQAKDILVIGDMDHDAEVASALGADCFLVADGYQSRARLEATGFPVFDSLSELEHQILTTLKI